MEQKRLPYFDLLKFFAMFLVIWGHCVERCVSRPCIEEPMWHFIYTFHMPLFMMISGYFSLSAIHKNNFGQLLLKKSRSLLLPVFSWTIIFLLIQPCFGLSNCNLFNTLWFLRSLFLCYVFYYIGNRLNFKGWKLLTILISQFIPFYNIPIMYPCFVLGALLKERHDCFELVGKYWWVLMGGFTVLMYFADYHLWIGISIKKAFAEHDWISFALYWYGRFYRIFTGLIGAMAFIGLFRLLYEKGAQNWMMDKICIMGRYTLEMYILQSVFTGFVLLAWVKVDEMNPLLFNFLFTPAISVLIVFISMGIIYIVNRSRWLTFVLFGK